MNRRLSLVVLPYALVSKHCGTSCCDTMREVIQHAPRCQLRRQRLGKNYSSRNRQALHVPTMSWHDDHQSEAVRRNVPWVHVPPGALYRSLVIAKDKFGVLIGSGIGGVEFFENNCAKFNDAGGGAKGLKKVSSDRHACPKREILRFCGRSSPRDLACLRILVGQGPVSSLLGLRLF